MKSYKQGYERLKKQVKQYKNHLDKIEIILCEAYNECKHIYDIYDPITGFKQKGDKR